MGGTEIFEAGITHLLKLLLEAKGEYDVRTESSGLRALAAAREFTPDLILMDVVMPGMSGADVAANLRKDPALKTIPLVFLTGTVQGEGPGSPPQPHSWIPLPGEALEDRRRAPSHRTHVGRTFPTTNYSFALTAKATLFTPARLTKSNT